MNVALSGNIAPLFYQQYYNYTLFNFAVTPLIHITVILVLPSVLGVWSMGLVLHIAAIYTVVISATYIEMA